MPLNIRFHDEALSICQLALDAPAPVEILRYPFTAFFRTKDEVTLICPTAMVPKNAKVESGFIPFEIVGPFEFDVIGILAQVANPLAAAGVSIVPLSTFNTDYVLIKADRRQTAVNTLSKAGHNVLENSL